MERGRAVEHNETSMHTSPPSILGATPEEGRLKGPLEADDYPYSVECVLDTQAEAEK